VKINRYFSTENKIFFAVKNPQKIFTTFTAGPSTALRSAQDGILCPFLRIDMQKVKQSEH
jgi:hypothetical protein